MLADLLTRAIPPWARWLALAAVAAALYGTGRVHQARVDHAEQVAADNARLVATVEQMRRRSVVANAAAAALEGDIDKIQTKARIIQKEVTRVVERPVYRDCSLDADGLRLYNAAQRGDAPASGEPADPVRAAAAAR